MLYITAMDSKNELYNVSLFPFVTFKGLKLFKTKWQIITLGKILFTVFWDSAIFSRKGSFLFSNGDHYNGVAHQMKGQRGIP